MNDQLKTKIEKVATEIYGAKGVKYSHEAEKEIRKIEKVAKGLPVCIAKTQFSLSDDRSLSGRPAGFYAHVGEVHYFAGAGFVLVNMGKVMLMPGMPEHPAAERM